MKIKLGLLIKNDKKLEKNNEPGAKCPGTKCVEAKQLGGEVTRGEKWMGEKCGQKLREPNARISHAK